MILETFPFGPFETNCLLIGCPKTRIAAVIDVPFESVVFLMRRIQELNITVNKILITHSHWDHIGEAALLKEKLNVPLFIHEKDAGNLIDPGSDGLPLFFPVKGVKPDVFLHEGDVLEVGTLKIKVIETPGHTPGGVCFYVEDQKTLISGDTLFRGTIGNLSFPTARPELMWESLKKLADLPSETKVYPGHGECTTIGAEQWIRNARQRF